MKNTSLIVRPSSSVPKIVLERVDAGGITVGELCQEFLAHKRTLHRMGELGIRSVQRYEAICVRIADVLGADAVVEDLMPQDFARLRESFATGYGPKTLAVNIQCTRTIFKYASDCVLIDRPVRFGQSFRKPPARIMRLARHERGLCMFEAAEIRKLLESASLQLYAMILLALNCGLGNSDVGRLPFKSLDLDRGWLVYPRHKTGIHRRCPLWSETVSAIRHAIAKRPMPASRDASGLVFLTRVGNCWATGEKPWSALEKAFTKLKKRAGIRRRGVGFYALRHTFQTVGDESLDPTGVSFIMGHAPRPGDMGSIYREKISDERLQKIVEHVRGWLWPKPPSTIDEARQQQAELVAELWESKEKLTGQDILAACEALKINQTELAAGMGYCLDWVNRLITGRNAISPEADSRFRRFFEQCAGRMQKGGDA